MYQSLQRGALRIAFQGGEILLFFKNLMRRYRIHQVFLIEIRVVIAYTTNFCSLDSEKIEVIRHLTRLDLYASSVCADEAAKL